MCNNKHMGHLRPIITDGHIAQISDLIRANPDWNRTKLSVELYRHWRWQCANGQIKDLSFHDMLWDLDKAGAIDLPPSQKPKRAAGWGADKVELLPICTDAINSPLRELMPIRQEIAAAKNDIVEFKSYIEKYHFMERPRFRSVCYAAANWLHVGETTVRGGDSKTSKATLPIKGVWLFPLIKCARAMLCAAESGRV